MTDKPKSKPTGLPAICLITISNSTMDLSDPEDNAANLGYGEVYQLRDHEGCPAGHGFGTPKKNDWIFWCCDQPFTFVTSDKAQWSTPKTWDTYSQWDGKQFAVLAALNSVEVSPPPKFRAKMPAGMKNWLALTAIGVATTGAKIFLCEYTIIIPQVDPCVLTGCKREMMALPPGNPLIRATIIFQ